MNFDIIDNLMLDHRVKGMPGGVAPFRQGDIGSKGWNVLREDMTLPVGPRIWNLM